MRPLIAGNWKMHGTAPQLGEIAAIAAAIRTAPAAAEVGGALVGGASLKATDFYAIVRAIPTHA